jgi:hypothetical protein
MPLLQCHVDILTVPSVQKMVISISINLSGCNEHGESRDGEREIVTVIEDSSLYFNEKG